MTIYQILSILGIPSLMVSIVIYGVNYIKYKISSQKLIKDGVLAILHNKIYKLGQEYIAIGEITVSDMSDFEYLYSAYHKLGGNGTGTEIYERVKELPIKQERS